MPGSPAPIPSSPSQAVICYTCHDKVAEGDDIADGQPLLTKHADKSCARSDCPHKTDAIETAKRHRGATQGDLESIKRRLDTLEGKVK
jgi:hypothetical protein